MAHIGSLPEGIQAYRCLAPHSTVQTLLGTSFWDAQSAALNVLPPMSDPPRATFGQTIRETRGSLILHFPPSSTGGPARLLLLAYNRNRHVGSQVGAPVADVSADFAAHWLVMARAHLLIEGPTFNITPYDPEYHILTGSDRSQ